MPIIVPVTVIVLDRLVDVLVVVILAEQQPRPGEHDCQGANKLEIGNLSQKAEGNERADERRGAVKNAGPGRAHPSQSQDKQRETESVAECAQEHREKGAAQIGKGLFEKDREQR